MRKLLLAVSFALTLGLSAVPALAGPNGGWPVEPMTDQASESTDATGTEDTGWMDEGASSSSTVGEVIDSTCDGHHTIGYHKTAAGNEYRLLAHVCVGRVWNTTVQKYAYHARTHLHCTRNTVAYLGCRVNIRVLLHEYDDLVDNRWEASPNTYRDFYTPTGKWFKNSGTLTSRSSFYFQQSIRGAVQDPDNVRFLLADGTTVLKDLGDSVSNPITAN